MHFIILSYYFTSNDTLKTLQGPVPMIVINFVYKAFHEHYDNDRG